ncbi:MAG: hypothetical protein AAGE61_16695, partial [Pseudomonadota bacterium]
MSSTHSVPSLFASYGRMLEAAGEFAPKMRRSFILNTIAAVVEGLAFACFYPLSIALLSAPADISGAWFWLGVMVVLAAVDASLRWTAMQFSFGPDLAQVNYDL